MDDWKQIGKYLKKTKRDTDLALKRPVLPQISSERIRDVFDSTHPVQAYFKTPQAGKKTLLDINFGKKLPSIACCGDCFCGITESYTWDSTVSGSIYVTQAYVPDSTIVYLDGVRATKGADYTEANPATGQIAILASNVDAIVISYVYTVGNCTEAVCIDGRFECLGYTFLTGLTTVFADRFDSDVRPSGGCGGYFIGNNFLDTTPLISNNKGIFGGTGGFWLGGKDRLVGKSVEVLVGVDLDDYSINESATFTLRGAYTDSTGLVRNSSTFIFTKLSSTTMRLRLGGAAITYEGIDNPFGPIDSDFIRTVGATVDATITITGGSYWFRFAQLSNALVSKAWPQFTTEPSGAQNTLTMTDINTQSPIDEDEFRPREFRALNINNIAIDADGVEAIMVGAGLDNGRWGLNANSFGAEGFYCAEIPDAEIRFGYNCGVNGSSTVTVGAVGEPSAQWSYSWPQFFPPDGSGRIVTYDQRIMGINTGNVSLGNPTAIRIKGEIVGTVWNNAVFVEFKKYPTGTLTMGGVNGFQGGQTLATFMVPTDGTPVPIDIFVPVDPNEGFVRVGVHVPNTATLATQQPTAFGFPTFSNSVTNTITFYWFHAEAVQSVQCTTGPFCEDCV